MKPFIALLVSLYILVAFLSWISVSSSKEDLMLREWRVGEKTFKVPFKISIEEATMLKLSTEFESEESDEAILVIPRLLSHGFEVYVNEEPVFNLLMKGEYLNLWTTSFHMKVRLREGRNEIVVISQNLYDFKMRWAPYITRTSSWKIDMSNIIGNVFPALSAGLSTSVGIFLAILAFKRRRSYYVYFSHVFAMFGIYLLDSTLLPLTLNGFGFSLMKRIFYFSLHGSFALFPMGLDMFLEERISKFSRFVGYGIMIPGFFVLLYPNFYVARMVHYYSGPYFLFISYIVFHKLRKRKEKILKLSTFFFFLTALQHALSAIGNFPVPSIIGFGSMYFILSFMYFLTVEYRRIESELLKTREELFKDPLTGAYNRRMLEILEFDENDSVVFFDFDDFKEINDEFGHAYGDEVLKEFVRVSKGTIRKGDIVVRYGGDEFVLVLKNCEEKKARSIAESIARNFSERTGVRISYGVASVGRAPIEALAEADMRMYEMKREKKV